MDIGTAKATAAERARVPHHGLDLVDPDEPFTAADFARHATGVLRAIAGRGRLAILVGGTGLYLRAVGRGLPLEATGRDPAIRAELEARLASGGLDALVAELRATAPTLAARTDLANPRRVVRALERARIAGDRPPPAPIGYPGPSAWLGLAPEPADHARAIDARAREQFDAGLAEEAAALRERYPDELRAFSAMGYHEAFALLDGAMDRETAIATDAARTRAYARRQRTWFRAEPGIDWHAPGREATRAALMTAERLRDAGHPGG
jgi:tRNA dimethylallyltransferase